jgi:hypothetical protein
MRENKMDGAGGTYGGEEKYVEDLVEGILKDGKPLKHMGILVYDKIWAYWCMTRYGHTGI